MFIRGAHIGTKWSVQRQCWPELILGMLLLCVEVIFRNTFSWTGARRDKGFLPVLFCSGMPVLLVGEFGDTLGNREGEESESFSSC